jgi:uncharacterized protein (TIGR00730 family)
MPIINRKKLAENYPYKVTVFSSRNEVSDKSVMGIARSLGRAIAQKRYILVNGGSATGLMGEISKATYKAGGQVYGVNLLKYEPEPHPYLTNWEAYSHHWERQRRLIEMGDIYIALPGAVGTLHEVLEVHIMNILREFDRPLILVGDYTNSYEYIINYFKEHGLMHKDHTRLIFAKDAEEAMKYVDSYFSQLKKKNYFSPIYYPALSPEKIFEHLKQNANPYEILFEGIKMTVLPNVYPSNRFRSSLLLGKIVKELSKGKKVADIACGHGTMGLVAIKNGAKHVVQVDINPAAVKNARLNAENLGVSNKLDIYEGDTFEPLAYRYQKYFDIIFFNPPFHRDAANKDDKLMYAFYTQGNEGGILDKFLRRAKDYLHPKGYIVLGFSNKDPESLKFLEGAIIENGYKFSMYELVNKNSAADNRVYKITIAEEKQKEISSEKENYVRLGLILANSGVAKNDGRNMKHGVEMAVEDLKVENIKVDVGYHDDKSGPAQSIEGSIAFVNKFKPDAIIGPTWSYIIDAAAYVLEDAMIPYFTPATSSDVLVTKTEYRISGAHNNDPKETLLSGWFKKNKAKKIAFVQRENKWGDIHSQIVSDATAHVGGEVVFRGILNKKGDNVQIIKKGLQKSRPDVLILDNYEDVTLPLLDAVKAIGLTCPIITTLWIPAVIKQEIKKSNLKNDLYIIESEIPDAFIERYKRIFGAEPHEYAFNAYAGTMIMVEAVRQARKKKKDVKNYIVEDLKMDIFGKTFAFAKNGDLQGSDWVIKRVIV